MPLYGQYGFNRSYSFNNGPTVLLDAKYNHLNDVIYASAIFFDTTDTFRTVHSLLTLDKNGNLLDTVYKKLSYDYFLREKNLAVTPDSGFLAIGDLGTSNYTVVLYKYKSDTVLWHKLLTDTNTARGFISAKVINGMDDFIYCLIDYQENDYTHNIMIIKLNNNGQEVCRKKYGMPYWDDTPSCIELLNDGSLMIGAVKGEYSTVPSGQNEYYRTQFFHIDTGGTILQQWADPDWDSYFPGQIVQIQDGGYIYCGAYVDFRSLGRPYLLDYISRMDSNFNRIWDIQLGNIGSYCSLEDLKIKNNLIYAVGNEIADSNEITDDAIELQAQFGVLYILDMSGNVLYKRYYYLPESLRNLPGVHSPYPQLYTIDFINDSTLIMAGEIPVNFSGPHPGIPIQYGWLIKTDLYGCLFDTCRPIIEPIPKPYQPPPDEVLLFPNPTQGFLQLNVPSSYISGNFYISDIQGRIIQQGTIVSPVTVFDLEYYLKGVYAIRIEKENTCETIKFVRK